MSEFNFKVGDKVRESNWNKGECTRITGFGEGRFLGIDHNKIEEDWKIHSHWLPYEEPRPEFDWEAEGFWGKHKKSGEIYFFAKTSKWTWESLRYNNDTNAPDWECMSLKAEIVEKYEPCSPPSWANLIDEAI